MTIRNPLRASATAAFAGLLLAGAILVPASPASADIDYCVGGYGANGAESFWAGCEGSAPSRFQARATCYKESTGAPTPKAGPWRAAGGDALSTITCASGYFIAGGWIEEDE